MACEVHGVDSIGLRVNRGSEKRRSQRDVPFEKQANHEAVSEATRWRAEWTGWRGVKRPVWTERRIYRLLRVDCGLLDEWNSIEARRLLKICFATSIVFFGNPFSRRWNRLSNRSWNALARISYGFHLLQSDLIRLVSSESVRSRNFICVSRDNSWESVDKLEKSKKSEDCCELSSINTKSVVNGVYCLVQPWKYFDDSLNDQIVCVF